MRIFSIILIAIAIIVAIPLIAALFVKKDYAVEREIVIEKPENEVFNYIRLLKNQNNFSKWASLDPNMKTDFRGTDGTVGFVSAWESNDKHVGKGEQEITKIEEGQRIDYEIRFMEPFAAKSPAYMITDSLSGDQARVKWGFTGHMKYPLNIMLLFMDMESAIGKDFETGLSNLKTIVESEQGS